MNAYPWNLRLTGDAWGVQRMYGWQGLANALTRHYRKGFTAGELETIFGPDCREAYRLAALEREGADDE